jgi:hypothetical protein
MWWVLRFVVFVIVAMPIGAWAQNKSEAQFYDASLLTAAQREIVSANLDELRALADLLVDCSNFYDGDNLKPEACERRIDRYRIEYDRDRSIDALFNAYSTMLLVERFDKDKAKTARFIQRHVEIQRKLERTINLTFNALRDSPKK